MTARDRYLDDAAATVIRNHGDRAAAFAADRLDFCRSADFADGIELWEEIVARVALADAATSPATASPQHRPA